MYKMIIVDDHSYLIEGMQRFVNWDELGIEIIDVAFDGEEGLKKIRMYHPDIVITDISMPVMDGLDMIKILKDEGFNTKFIILTAYNQFEYAKEALRYGVVDYIVKPALPKDITEIVSKVVNMCNEEKKHQVNEMKIEQQLLENRILIVREFMEELLEGGIRDEADVRKKAEQLKIVLDKNIYRVITVQMDDYHIYFEKYKEKDWKFFLYSIISIICGNLGINEDFTVVNEEKLHFIISYDNSLDMDRLDNTLCVNLQDIVSRCINSYGINLSIGVGSIVDSILKINTSYKESAASLMNKSIPGSKQIIFYKDICHINNTEQAVQSLTHKSSPQSGKVVKQILDYIENNYNKDISLNELSKKVYFTPNYLGNIFAKQFKKSFNDYIAEYRIEKAKELMSSHNYKVYEISEMVGYKDTDYFRRIFKDYVGVSPSEYMKNIENSIDYSCISAK